MNILRTITKERKFNFDPPQMYYDKEIGEVRIKPRAAVKEKKIINNMDELE
jgi:hypothetical protein